jgi:hypothetical protein
VSVRWPVKVPKRFELQGRTIKVRVCEVDDAARWYPALDLIEIDSESTPDQRCHGFLHEAVHAWFEALGRHDLSDDERLVDGLSALIHQAIKTGR